MVDGATRFSVLWRVMLPLVRPGLIVAGIFAAIFIWNELLVGSYLIQSQGLKTIPLARRRARSAPSGPSTGTWPRRWAS